MGMGRLVCAEQTQKEKYLMMKELKRRKRLSFPSTEMEQKDAKLDCYRALFENQAGAKGTVVLKKKPFELHPVNKLEFVNMGRVIVFPHRLG